MKKRIALLLLFVIAVTSFVGCTTSEPAAPAANNPAPAAPAEPAPAEPAPAPSGETQYVNIATGGTAGTYFPLGGAFAEIWNNTIPGVNATSQSTGASVANINLLYDGKIEVAMVQNDIAWYSNNGVEMFEGEKFEDLRGLTTLHNEPIQLITTNPEIKGIQDLKGKRVSVGAIGSGNEANARQILTAAGLDIEKDIKPMYLPYSETISGMKDNQIDVAIFTTGMPNSGIQELALQREVIMVPVEKELRDQLKEEYSFFTDLIAPANTYKGQTEDVEGITVKALLAVKADMSDELAYELTKQIYENHDRVVAAHALGKTIIPENALNGMSIPLHPGAEKYFKEAGLLK